ncbi:TPA: PBS lyase, partial [Pseudomonas aeruginosa]
ERADLLLALKPYWQQLDYLLRARPGLAADDWQRLLFAWRERRGSAIDYATSAARREELLAHLQALQEQRLLSRQIVIDALR